MADQDKTQSTPVWKIALIPVLLVGLVWNVTRDADEVPAIRADARPVADAEVALSVTDVLQELQRARQAEASRGSIELSQIIEHDPFSLVGQLASRSGISEIVDRGRTVSSDENSQEERLAQTRVLTAPVKAVLNGPHGAVALIDSRILRVGDYVEPDLRIVSIEPHAVVVELAQHQDSLLTPE